MERKYKGKIYYEKEMELLKQNYKLWRENNRKQNAPFFVVYKDLQHKYLKELSGGAVKLFLYLGFHINTFTGECWVSSKTIAEYFGNDERTVKKWFNELEEKGLIVRIQTGYRRVANTFLLPYGGDPNNE